MALKEKILQVMGGLHVAAVATVFEGNPAVRFLALTGYDDLSLIGATMKESRKVSQMKKKSDVALSIWSGKDFTDPYVVVLAKGTIHEDSATKKRFWDPMKEKYFKSPDNPNYVILKFIPSRIEYYDQNGMEVWGK